MSSRQVIAVLGAAVALTLLTTGTALVRQSERHNALSSGELQAFLLQLAYQFGRHVLAHAGNVVVAPMALQGVEVLLRATQKYLCVKPGWCFVLRCRLRARGGGGGREHPGGFALHAGRAAG